MKFMYTPTLDTVYQTGKLYYVFDATNNIFSEDSYIGGQDIPTDQQRFEKLPDPVS